MFPDENVLKKLQKIKKFVFIEYEREPTDNLRAALNELDETLDFYTNPPEKD